MIYFLSMIDIHASLLPGDILYIKIHVTASSFKWFIAFLKSCRRVLLLLRELLLIFVKMILSVNPGMVLSVVNIRFLRFSRSLVLICSLVNMIHGYSWLSFRGSFACTEQCCNDSEQIQIIPYFTLHRFFYKVSV